MPTRQEAETKLNEIETTLLAGSGRATREIARQLVALAHEALEREATLERGAGHLDQLVVERTREYERVKTDYAQSVLRAAADCESRLARLQLEHQRRIQELAGL